MTRAGTPWGAVRAVARSELRASWRTLVALGLLLGLLGGVVVSAAALARRTGSAYPRLVDTVNLEDARVTIPGATASLTTKVTSLPGISRSWVAAGWVGQVEGPTLNYIDVFAGADHPADLVRPVLVSGRAPRDHAAQEAMVSEPAAQSAGLTVGSVLVVHLLSADQVGKFGVGFGAPAGPTVRLSVVGIGRMPAWGNGLANVLASPAFAAAYGGTSAYSSVFLRLQAGAAAKNAFSQGIADLAAANPTAPKFAELGPIRVSYPTSEQNPSVTASENVLVLGLAVFAGIVALAALLVVAQGMSREHASRRVNQQIELALGLTRWERTLARAVPSTVGAAVAAAVCLTISVATARVAPLGGLRRFEPAAGFQPNLSYLAVGTVLVAGTFVVLAAGSSWLAGRPAHSGSTSAPSRSSTRWLWSRPEVSAGIQLASLGGRDRRGLPALTTVVATAAGIAGVVAAASFGASVDRLTSSPNRYGWSADLTLVDAKAPDIAALIADPRVAHLDLVRAGPVRIGGQQTNGYEYEHRKGALPWTVIDGRLPTSNTEVALGPRTGRDLGLYVGDEVSVTGPDGRTRVVRIVGLVTAQPANRDRLGDCAVFTGSGLGGTSNDGVTVAAYVKAVPGEAGSVARSLSSQLETQVAYAPAEISDLRDVGSLPDILAIVLGLVTATGLLHVLVTNRRRRAREIAILTVLGLTPAQVRWALATSAAVIAVPAALLGIPVGLLVGRVLWAQVAGATGVAGDLDVPVGVLVVVALVAVIGAVAAAAVPAGRSRRTSTAAALSSA